MKMEKQHYEKLRSEILYIEEKLPAMKYIYKNANRSKERYCWDLLFKCNENFRDFIFKNLYSYLNDDHINTALNKIIQY
jgi:hypothetical protein